MEYVNEAIDQYAYARKLAKKDYRASIRQGNSGYLIALEEIVCDYKCTCEYIGVIDVPSFLIVGTKTSLRKKSFSNSFLPLLKSDTEFGLKWRKVCEYHLSDTGISEPPEVIEYLGKFYVVEGNKRVSVLKSYGAPSITCDVTRLMPPKSEKPDILMYYEFLNFYKLSKLYSFQFSKSGYYKIFQRALGFEEDHIWDKQERINIIGFGERLSRDLKRNKINSSFADCFAAMLEMYTFDFLHNMSDKQLNIFINEYKNRLIYGKGFYKIWCIGDEEDKLLYSPEVKDILKYSDLIISTGDLDAKYLEYIVTLANKPLLYVPGNHDGNYLSNPPEGCVCIDDEIYDYCGMKILGLGGSKYYNGGPYQYTEEEMAKRIKNLKRKIRKAKGIDIIVSHAPIKGYGDMSDEAHQGFKCFKKLLEEVKPRYWFYGHVHLNYQSDLPRILTINNTILVNVSGKYECKC